MAETRLPAGARRALMRLGRDWQLPGRATFSAGGAWSACNLGLAEQREVKGGRYTRYEYRLTEAGARAQAGERAHG